MRRDSERREFDMIDMAAPDWFARNYVDIAKNRITFYVNVGIQE